MLTCVQGGAVAQVFPVSPSVTQQFVLAEVECCGSCSGGFCQQACTHRGWLVLALS